MFAEADAVQICGKVWNTEYIQEGGLSKVGA